MKGVFGSFAAYFLALPSKDVCLVEPIKPCFAVQSSLLEQGNHCPRRRADLALLREQGFVVCCFLKLVSVP
uniref:Uncharacterized protein n=1 Tax=Arundo donax TaxID=35708 RepID=A0A0A9B3P2_ARUDO